MPVFGQVDKASADDGKIVAKIEIQQNDGHQLPLGSDPADLDSQKYENGQGDVLIVTYTDGTSTDYYCQDINWNFLSEAGKKIKVILDEWVDDPDSFVAGNDYEATAWVYSADEGTGVSKYDDLVNVSIKILAPLKKVTGVTLSLGKQIQLEENKEGKYNCIGDICCNEGDVAIAEYEDSSKVTFTCDANGNFRDDQNNDLPICFEWVDDGTATIDNSGSLTGEPGKTYSVYAYTFETVTQSVYGDEVYVVDEGGTKAVFPISIADHSWAADYTIDKEATCSEEGSKAIYCTVCGAKDETSVTTIPKAGHSWTVAYKWSSDNKSVKATATCRNNASHKETETVKTTSKVTKKATYTAMGQTTYTAKFTKPAFKTQTKVLTNVAKLVKKNQPMQVKTAVKKVKAKKLKKIKQHKQIRQTK